MDKKAFILWGSVNPTLLLPALAKAYVLGDVFFYQHPRAHVFGKQVDENPVLRYSLVGFDDAAERAYCEQVLQDVRAYTQQGKSGYSRQHNRELWEQHTLSEQSSNHSLPRRDGLLLRQCAILYGVHAMGIESGVWISDCRSSKTAAEPLQTLAAAVLPKLKLRFAPDM